MDPENNKIVNLCYLKSKILTLKDVVDFCQKESKKHF